MCGYKITFKRINDTFKEKNDTIKEIKYNFIEQNC